MASTHESIGRSSYAFSFLDKTLRNFILKKLGSIGYGSIEVIDPYGTTYIGDAKQHDFPKAKLIIENPLFYRNIALKGALGAGESYMEGHWYSDNLVDLIAILAINQNVLASFEKGFAVLQRPLAWLFTLLSKNTIKGSKKNISAHYDLSNEMFQLFLDKNMMYSSAFYERSDSSLDEAAISKLERICQKMQLSPQDNILEIGTGWGGFAIYAAKNYGCQVTTTTISKEQYDYATRQVKEAGLEDKVTLYLKDYRDLSGQFDKIFSIEMIEAVGADFLDEYLRRCSNLLKPSGQLFLQAITINDQNYERALKEVDFIKKYIFPGSFIPSLNAISTSAKNATDLRLYHLEDLTPHYARTLLDWRKRFLSKAAELKHLGFDERFIKMWEYYFCYCAGGFREHSIGSVHLVFGKPRYRQDLSRINTWKKGV